jgi:hypothetical protein
MKIANILMLSLLVALIAETGLAASYDDFQRYRKGNYYFDLETQYFHSDANYISSGESYQKLPYDQYFNLLNIYLKARYDMSKRSSWYGNLNMATATSNGVDAKRTNSSLADATFGFAYMPYNENFDVITDFNLLIPFNKVSINTDTVMNNEGVIQATGLMRIQKEFNLLAPFGYIGGTYRQERSALLPWGGGLEFHWPAWTLGGKVFGYQSITDDPDTGNKTQRLIVNDRVNAASLKFYAVNPSVVDSELYMKVKFGDWALSAGGGATITGSSDAAGFHIGANIRYTWETQPSYYLRPSTPSTHEDSLGSEKKVPKFKEEINDGVDQKLFKPTPPPSPRPAPKPGADLTPASESVAIKRVGPKPAPTPEEPLDGGEVQLKLKRKRKPKST